MTGPPEDRGPDSAAGSADDARAADQGRDNGGRDDRGRDGEDRDGQGRDGERAAAARIRAELRRRAADDLRDLDTGGAEVLAERILAALDRPLPFDDDENAGVNRPDSAEPTRIDGPDPTVTAGAVAFGRGRSWRVQLRRGAPLLAAAVVVGGLVAGGAVGLHSAGSRNATSAGAGTSSSSLDPLTGRSPRGDEPVGAATAAASGDAGAASRPASPPNASLSSTDGSGSGPAVVDLHLGGDGRGWALGTRACGGHGPARCGVLLTGRVGEQWVARPLDGPRLRGSGCVARCVDRLLAVDRRTLYAYGPQVIWLSPDGGRRWRRLSGGALALAAVRTGRRIDVLRASTAPDRRLAVSAAPAGAGRWRALPAPRLRGVRSATFVNGADHASPGLVVGGASPAFLRIGTGGARLVADGCPPGSVVLAAAEAPAGRDAGARAGFAFLCRRPGGGVVLRPGDHPVPSGRDTALAGGGAGTLLVAGRAGVARSVDGGRTWLRVPAVTGPVVAIGLAARAAWALGVEGVWVGNDGGRRWQRLVVGPG